MDGKRSRSTDRRVKRMEDFERLVTDRITKPVRESLGVGLHNFLHPLEQANSKSSPKAADRREPQRYANEGRKFKEEPTTPRSCSKPHSVKQSGFERKETPVTVRSNIQACKNPKSNASFLIRKAWDSSPKKYFKMKCNLRVSISDSKNSSLNRQVYAMNCDHDAETREVTDNAFANCYDSCMQDRQESFSSDEDLIVEEDLYVEKCTLKVSPGASCYNCNSHNRGINVVRCDWDCGELCENRKRWGEIFEANSDWIDADSEDDYYSNYE